MDLPALDQVPLCTPILQTQKTGSRDMQKDTSNPSARTVEFHDGTWRFWDQVREEWRDGFESMDAAVKGLRDNMARVLDWA